MIDIETMKQTRDMYIEAVSVINNITAKLMKMGSGATELPDYRQLVEFEILYMICSAVLCDGKLSENTCHFASDLLKKTIDVDSLYKLYQAAQKDYTQKPTDVHAADISRYRSNSGSVGLFQE